jgi:hypothetical protein
MAEIERNGFETVWKRVLDETKGKRLYNRCFLLDNADDHHLPESGPCKMFPENRRIRK